MTIMDHHLPLNPEGITGELSDALADGFPLFESVQTLARLGIRVTFEVSPSVIVANLTVSWSATSVLPRLLDKLDQANIVATPGDSGQFIVTGSMCQGVVMLRVLIPAGWVTATELASLINPGTDEETAR
ncbi:hypothetical protein ACODT4_44655 [Streptomyces sp. 2.9]|uniref:hypothetical protein n=1 Tax=Streptomyces tritrimontium TaxID=3406573 RepID=UPI003BB50E3C